MDAMSMTRQQVMSSQAYTARFQTARGSQETEWSGGDVVRMVPFEDLLDTIACEDFLSSSWSPSGDHTSVSPFNRLTELNDSRAARDCVINNVPATATNANTMDADRSDHRGPRTGAPSSRMVTDTVLEDQRRRQRAYERKYRVKKRDNLFHLRKEWARLELDLNRLWRTTRRSYVFVPSTSKLQLYRHSLNEEKCLEYDKYLLHTISVWYSVAEFRQYNEEMPVLRTQAAWERVEQTLLGVSVDRPFVPSTFQFDWH